MAYNSRSIDSRAATTIRKDFMDRRMSFQNISIKHELPISDIKYHLSRQLEVPKESLISMRSLKRKAYKSKGKPPSRTIGMTIDILAHRFDLLDGSETLPRRTLQEIGDKHGVTKQRIEQIEKEVAKYLKEFNPHE